MWNPFGYFVFPIESKSFLKSQFTTLPYPEADFDGQTIIVTGASGGLGIEAARHFVRLRAGKVILACRSIEKGEAAKRSIEETTGCTNVVEVWSVDLSSYESVRIFCARAQELERLDILVENAGVATPHYEVAEGMESSITINVISTFLMALLMLPKLRACSSSPNACPHIVIVGSSAHAEAIFREQDSPSIFGALKLQSHQEDRYNTSKLIQLLFLRELAAATQASENAQLIINSISPGFCTSDLMRHSTFPLKFLVWLGGHLIGRTSEMGSRTLIAGAVAGRVSHGKYMMDCNVAEPSAWVRSSRGEEIQKKLFAELLEVLDAIQPGIIDNI